MIWVARLLILGTLIMTTMTISMALAEVGITDVVTLEVPATITQGGAPSINWVLVISNLVTLAMLIGSLRMNQTQHKRNVELYERIAEQSAGRALLDQQHQEAVREHNRAIQSLSTDIRDLQPELRRLVGAR
jgi:type VI protein secretion system component VasK